MNLSQEEIYTFKKAKKGEMAKFFLKICFLETTSGSGFGPKRKLAFPVNEESHPTIHYMLHVQ